MNLEEEIRNSAGKAEALADEMHPIKKTILNVRAEYRSVLIAIGYRMERAITKVKMVIK
ncbi:hypothetical protein [Bacillus pumilus]|uniref:hypothetical protein n=1 Tax=Bacillus pumilus TaxID=1408 RepID=UPI00164264C2|nr:hypothetical protein [Bacillus pumilus]